MNTVGTPEQLRLIALIGRTGTLAGAADVLGVTPAAITQQLVRAEQDWGAPLVQRTTRGARLTEAGRLLALHGVVVDEEVARAQDAFAAMRGLTRRRLRIGAFQAAALHLLPPALTALRHRSPDVDLTVKDLQSQHAVSRVAHGDLDLALMSSWDEEPDSDPHVRLIELMRDPLVIVLPDDHPRARSGRGRVRLDLFRDDAWVLIQAGHVARLQFDRAAADAGFVPNVRFETESYDVAQALVATGYGVALVSRLALTNVADTVHRPLAEPGLVRRIWVAVAHDLSLSPMAQEFVDLLQDVARGTAARWHPVDRHRR